MAQDSKAVRAVVLRRIQNWTHICIGGNKWFLLIGDVRDVLEDVYLNGGDEAVRLERARGRGEVGTGEFENVRTSEIIETMRANIHEDDD